MGEPSERAAHAHPVPAAAATVSSLKSENSTEQLIGKPKVKTIKSVRSVTSKSVEAASESRGRSGGEAGRRGRGRGRGRLVVWLGLAQLVLGAMLAAGGALALAKGAALARTGAGLWAGCVGVVAGVVGVLAGINDCYGLSHGPDRDSGGGGGGSLLTAFLALSLLSLACGNGSAVLAATGLQRDAARAAPSMPSFQEEMDAWTPVLTNIGVLLTACAQCVAAAASAAAAARRVCSCLRRRKPYDLNTFDAAAFKLTPDSTVLGDRGRDLALQLEGKLHGDPNNPNNTKDDPPEYGSADSKEKLVSRWLHQGAPGGPGGPPAGPSEPQGPMAVPVPTGPRRPRPAAAAAAGVRKPHKPPQVMLVPAHPASTLGRVPPCVMVGPRYATLPLPPAPYGPHPPIYYPVHDTRGRRRRSPREHRERRRRDERARGREWGRERERERARGDAPLERIHRKRRARAERGRLSDAELKRTYTGLDRAYAEQFIAVCDESRHAHEHAQAHAHSAERHDSLASITTSGSSHTSHSRS